MNVNASTSGAVKDNQKPGSKDHKFKPTNPNQTHTLDKQSGTGQGKELKKNGAGKGNWGKETEAQNENKDNEKTTKEYYQDKEAEESEEENRETLEEYYTRINPGKAQQEKTEKISASERNEQKVRELAKKEGMVYMESKDMRQIDDHQQRKKPEKKEWIAQMNTENSELLGLTTGFVLQP
jgi:plasminogen activator inhibitor 1 RNA-binding protein